MTESAGLRTRVQRLGLDLNEATWFRFLRSGLTIYVTRRCFGMSAEAAFWAIFTLPFLVLGLVAATAGVAQFFGEDVTEQVRETIIDAASRVLTPEAVQDFLVPLIDSVLRGHGGLTILGLVAALWSGSRIFATFAEGSVAIYGQPKRGYARTRALGLFSYLVGLAAVALIAVSILVFPDAWSAVVGLVPGGERTWVLGSGFLFLVAATATMMFIANPIRTNWLHQIPGGVLAVIIWILGSLGLQLYFTWLFRSGSVYGAIASVIAVMVWALVTTTAVFIGMTLNVTIRLARQSVFLTPAIVLEARRVATAAEWEAGSDDQDEDALRNSRPPSSRSG